MSQVPFRIEYTTTTVFGTTAQPLQGGDFFQIVSSSIPLNLVFKNENGSEIARATGVQAGLKLNFRTGKVLGSDVLVQQFAKGDFDKGFYSVWISAASSVTPTILITEGIDCDSGTFSGIFQMIGAGSTAPDAVVSKTDAQTLAIAANSARRDLIIKSGSGSAGKLWTGGALNTGISLSANNYIVYENFTGAITVYSEGANDIQVEEVLN